MNTKIILTEYIIKKALTTLLEAWADKPFNEKERKSIEIISTAAEAVETLQSENRFLMQQLEIIEEQKEVWNK